MQELAGQSFFQKRLNHLKIICQISLVYIGFAFQFHDGAHFAVLHLVHHNKRFRHFADLHGINLFGHFGWQVLELEFAAAGIHIGHQTGIKGCVLILRELDNCLLKCHRSAIHNQRTNAIQFLQ